MSHDFIKDLQEAVITYLGKVPARSIRKDDEEDDLPPEDQAPGSGEMDDLQAGKDGQDAFHGQDDFNPELDADLEQHEGDPAEGDPEDDTPKGDAIGEPQDPERMGDIRTVKGAHLVYKRQKSDGSFTELWMYNIGDHVDDAISIKKAILAGTDIPEGKLRSEDGKQMYELCTMGNAQLLCIDGLSN